MEDQGPEIPEQSTGNEEEKLTRLTHLRAELYHRDSRNFHKKVVTFARSLQEKYPGDYHLYRLYHLLIGSTPPGSVTKFDLPEGEIERFLEDEAKTSSDS